MLAVSLHSVVLSGFGGFREILGRFGGMLWQMLAIFLGGVWGCIGTLCFIFEGFRT